MCQDIGETRRGRNRPMDKGRYLVEAHVREGRRVAELAASHGVSKLVLPAPRPLPPEGEAGLLPRSKRPHRSPTRSPDELEDEIVELESSSRSRRRRRPRTRSTPTSPAARRSPVAHSTIRRVLRRRGFITPEPHKRPSSSYVRFEAALPNECWQSDITHGLADGTVVEMLNVIDDHSRLCVATAPFRSPPPPTSSPPSHATAHLRLSRPRC